MRPEDKNDTILTEIISISTFLPQKYKTLKHLY